MALKHRSVLTVLRTLMLTLALCSWQPIWAQKSELAIAVQGLEAEVVGLRQEVSANGTGKAGRDALAAARATRQKALVLQEEVAAPAALIEQRIEQLGQDATTSPDPAVRQQHLQLTRERAEHNALARRTALAQVEITQLIGQLAEAQARALGQELLLRSSPPLSISLWREGLSDLVGQVAHLRFTSPDTGSQSSMRWAAWVMLILWPLIAVLAHTSGVGALERVGERVAQLADRRHPATARALFAVWTSLIGVLVPALWAAILARLLSAAAVPAAAAQLVNAVAMAGVVALGARSLMQAVFRPDRPHWRLWLIDSQAAAHGLRAGYIVAAAIALIFAAEGAMPALGADGNARLLLQSMLALATTVQVGCALRWTSMMRSEKRLDPTNADAASQPAHLMLVVGIGWMAVTTIVLLSLFGYINLALRASQWIVWGAVVSAATLVLMQLVDALSHLLSNKGRGARAATPRTRALEQASVLLSAIGRLMVLALATGALLVPFGAGFTSVLELMTPLATGFEVGGVSVSALALLKAVLAYVVVTLLVRLLRAWMSSSYLPTTDLQPDARESIDKILRYAGLVLAFLWALTAFGIAMERVAILASALSVGIGFGLQAITQNFVSGLILLVERPVKIGDWVKINDVEGDIRRINVRSTEIRVGDHSTMIVPNSELITKVVQNKTMGNSLGRAQIFLSVPLDEDLDHAIAVVQGVLIADAEVLRSPGPSVFVDRVEGASVVLNCFVHVKSPRDSYSIRSRLLLSALRALRAGQIPANLPPQ